MAQVMEAKLFNPGLLNSRIECLLKVAAGDPRAISGMKNIIGLSTDIFCPLLQNPQSNMIEYSGDEPDGVKVLSQIPGAEGKNFEKAQEDPGNGHGNGEGMDLDEQTKAMAEEFAVLLNPNTTLTPHLCRKRCKNYDSVGAQKSAEFREFCRMAKDFRIERDSICRSYEAKYSLAEGY